MATAKTAIKLRLVSGTAAELPMWFKNKKLRQAVESSHRLALLSKNYSWYSQLGWAEDDGVHHDTYDYVWPVEKTQKTPA
jgi:hypothetical protein